MMPKGIPRLEEPCAKESWLRAGAAATGAAARRVPYRDA